MLPSTLPPKSSIAISGIGRLIIESEARGEVSDMMIAVVVLMLVGIVLSALMWKLQAYFVALAAARQVGVGR